MTQQNGAVKLRPKFIILFDSGLLFLPLFVRLEVGTAHRRNVAETSHVDNHRLIPYL
jgi:hypothetical protein